MTTTVTVTEETVDVTVQETTVMANVTERAEATVTVATGITDHGALSGLADDDHSHYLTTARHAAIGDNPHGVTAADVGADPAGSAAAVAGDLADHEADTSNPHQVTAQQAGALPTSGGTMTGKITLDGDPTNALHAATKQYVDAQSGGASDIGDLTAAGFAEDDFAQWNGSQFVNRTPAQVLADIGAAASGHNHDSAYINVAGDTMTGALIVDVETTKPFVVSHSQGDVEVKDLSGATTTTDMGIIFDGAGSYESGLITEVNGELLSYAINVPQLGSRVSSRLGWIFRADIRNSQHRGFRILKYPELSDSPTYPFNILADGDIYLGGGSTVPDQVGVAQLYVDQRSPTGAQPVLLLDQADVSEAMIEFVSTEGVAHAIEAVGAKTLTTTHFLKVTINGLTRYIPAGTIA